MLQTALLEIGKAHFCHHTIFNLLFPLADQARKEIWAIERLRREALVKAREFYQIDYFESRCPNLLAIIYSTLESVFGKN